MKYLTIVFILAMCVSQAWARGNTPEDAMAVLEEYSGIVRSKEFDKQVARCRALSRSAAYEITREVGINHQSDNQTISPDFSVNASRTQVNTYEYSWGDFWRCYLTTLETTTNKQREEWKRRQKEGRP